MPDQATIGNSPSDARPLASPSSDVVEAEPQQATAFGSTLEQLVAEAEAKLTPPVPVITIPDLGPLPPENAELLDIPLVDTDGVTHDNGRVLTPSPTATFFSPRLDLPGNTLMKTISDMSIAELEAYINEYKNLVRQAERVLDFRRVVLGASQLELSQRKQNEQRKLRNDKTKYPIKTVSMDPKTGKQVTKKAYTADQMLAMLAALSGLREKSDKK